MTKHDTVTQVPASLSRHTFLNPAYRPDHLSSDTLAQCHASGLAYKVCGLLDTVQSAFENDTLGIPVERRGIGETLEVVRAIAKDLLEATEQLEERVSNEASRD